MPGRKTLQSKGWHPSGQLARRTPHAVPLTILVAGGDFWLAALRDFERRSRGDGARVSEGLQAC
jgi:hypothetical protein